MCLLFNVLYRILNSTLGYYQILTDPLHSLPTSHSTVFFGISDYCLVIKQSFVYEALRDLFHINNDDIQQYYNLMLRYTNSLISNIQLLSSKHQFLFVKETNEDSGIQQCTLTLLATPVRPLAYYARLRLSCFPLKSIN